jgi:hypothetical protein
MTLQNLNEEAHNLLLLKGIEDISKLKIHAKRM